MGCTQSTEGSSLQDPNKKAWKYSPTFPDPSTVEILTHTPPTGAKTWHWEDYFWSGKKKLIPKYEALKSVDQTAVKALSYLKSRPSNLVDHLTRGLQTDLEKYRVLFRWIAENIKYDMQQQRKSVISASSQSVDDVLRTGLAVCTGYSRLYKELCKLAGLECETITGIARKASRDPEDYFTVDEPRFGPWSHMWNKIHLNNKWYLCDATWAAGSVDGDKFTKDWSEIWFLTDPESFVMSHLPYEGTAVSLIEQMVKNPFCTLQDFAKVPYISPKTPLYGMKPLSHQEQVIHTKTSHLTIQLKCPQKAFLEFATKLEKKGSAINGQYSITTYTHRVMILQQGDELHLDINLPGDGSYIFKVMGKPVAGDDTSTVVLITYKIKSLCITNVPAYFSQCNEVFGQYAKFRAAGYRVTNPAKGATIKTNNGRATVEVRLPSEGQIPNTHKLFVAENQQYRELKDCVHGERKGSRVTYHIRCTRAATYYFQIFFKPDRGSDANAGFYVGACYQIKCAKPCNDNSDKDTFVESISWGGPTRQFYNYGLSTSAKNSCIPVVNGRAELVVLKSRPNISVWATLSNKLHVAGTCLTKTTEDNIVTFTLQPPVKGFYFIKLYASNSNTGPEVALYCVKHNV